MDKVILSSNESQHECVFKGHVNHCQCLLSEDRQLTPPSKQLQSQGIVLFLLIMCLDEYYMYWCLF